MDSAAIAGLRGRLGDGFDDSARRRAEYSSDASNYRVLPEFVAFPRSAEEAKLVRDRSGEAGIPVTSRGAGTSVAGNAIGRGAVIDFSRHMNRVVAIDPDARTARVEPGVVLASLQHEAERFGLRFGPDPSTSSRATIGGMIGNNACGARSLAYGRTADNVLSLDVMDGRGRLFTAASGDRGFAAVPGLAQLVHEHLALIRTEFGRLHRQVSGYSLEHLLPENGSNLAAALVGSEGTLVTILEAAVRLVELPEAPVLVVLGYPDLIAAADVVPSLLEFRPTAMESMDARMIDAIRRRREAVVPQLPAGQGWLLVEVDRAGLERMGGSVDGMVRASGAIEALVVEDPMVARRIWRLRADGVGLAGTAPSGEPAWPGWEDAAVPPERLGDYLRGLSALLSRFRLDGLLYGHFGEGCVHQRIDFPLHRSSEMLGDFMREAAELAVSFGGSLSGEHGDGRARSSLLPVMYSPAAIRLMEKLKALFDPENRLNPGIIVDPAPLIADLRLPIEILETDRAGSRAGYAADGNELSRAVHRCVGVGKCRTTQAGARGFMCPSYTASLDEKDSTRGRARVLQEAIAGRLPNGLESPEVADSLDLCLSCKACASECPAGVDMAMLKSEVLFRRYRRRLRPRDHYFLGQLPRWLPLLGLAPRVVNRIASIAPLRRVILFVMGADSAAALPHVPRVRFSRWWLARSRARRLASVPPPEATGGRTVMLWIDSFSEWLRPGPAEAAVGLLADRGYRVVTPARRSCCGLTWVSTGQLDGARRRMRALLDELHPVAAQGIPIIGLEPSCLATLRSDLAQLLPEDDRVEVLASSLHTLAEFISAERATGAWDGWRPPDLSGTSIVVQPHCHHHAVLGFSPDARILGETGASITELTGCCGLAGNFGMQSGHRDLSTAIARGGLLPAIASAGPEGLLVADGFSCRFQASMLAGASALSLAEVLSGSPSPGWSGGRERPGAA